MFICASDHSKDTPGTNEIDYLKRMYGDEVENRELPILLSIALCVALTFGKC